MTVNRKKFIFSIKEFYNQPKDSQKVKKADVHAYFLQNELKQTKRSFSIHQQVLNLCFNLHKTEEQLRSEMDRTTRHRINQAIRDNNRIECITSPSLDDIKEYVEFYAPFAKEKNIGGCNEDRLIQLKEINKLVITSIFTNEGIKLGSHAIIANDGIAIGLYSCSGRFVNNDISSQIVSRANRYLYWYDILYFKSIEFHTFNFMGLSIDPNDHAHQNINKFKKGFGGEETIQYQSFIPQNFKGIIYSILLSFLWRHNKEVIRNGQMPVYKYQETFKNQIE